MFFPPKQGQGATTKRQEDVTMTRLHMPTPFGA